MSAEVAITFTPGGEGRCLYTECIDLSRIGELRIERATSIEFDDKAQYWRVHDTEGFAMFNSPSRQECLEWERQHLESLEDMKHEFSDRAGAVAAGT